MGQKHWHGQAKTSSLWRCDRRLLPFTNTPHQIPGLGFCPKLLKISAAFSPHPSNFMARGHNKRWQHHWGRDVLGRVSSHQVQIGSSDLFSWLCEKVSRCSRWHQTLSGVNNVIRCISGRNPFEPLCCIYEVSWNKIDGTVQKYFHKFSRFIQ